MKYSKQSGDRVRGSCIFVKLAVWIVFSLPCFLLGGNIEVDPGKSVIVLTQPDNRAISRAADELQKHFELITRVHIPIVGEPVKSHDHYRFHVGEPAPGEGKTAGKQESRWVIGPKESYFDGDTTGYGDGALFAVYSFLQDQFGVTWIEPGDEGIVAPQSDTLKLQTGRFSWTPKLMFRKIRQGGARIQKSQPPLPDSFKEYAEFRPSLEEHNDFAEDVIEWQKRMRMGGHRPGGGHAFHTWWKKYGAEHPGYFALNKYGKREPVPLPKAHQTDEFIKICASNPDVVKQLVRDWLPKKDVVRFVDTGLNDGIENFCLCGECAKLDVPKKGDKFHEHLTDRYTHLSNAVAREVVKERPDAMVTMYAYLTTLYPPRALRLEPNIVVQVVPYVIPLDTKVTRDLLGGWKEAGATMLAFRPNYHTKYLTTALPIGVEEQMFKVFRIAVENGCVSADYDSLVHNWPVTGMSDFVLAQAMSDPDKPFSYWENLYYSAFGEASAEVGDYYKYWRHEMWNKRLSPNIETISNKGGAGDFSRGLLWSLGEYYTAEDFEITNGILESASRKNLTEAERQRLEELQLANEHARLTRAAIAAAPMDKSVHAEKLLAFRKAHREDLKLSWMGVFAMELNNGDLSGLNISKEMGDYLKPWLKTELFWRFKLDAKEVGLEEEWQNRSWTETADWELLRTDRFWERQFNFDETSTLSDDVQRVIGDYDGIGWYAARIQIPADWKGREVYLRFGAVDESCWVYVNGEEAGRHIYKRKNDWKTPFEIPLNDHIDWNADHQLVTVRVEDRGGVGGIWRPVWVVSKPAEGEAQ